MAIALHGVETNRQTQDNFRECPEYRATLTYLARILCVQCTRLLYWVALNMIPVLCTKAVCISGPVEWVESTGRGENAHTANQSMSKLESLRRRMFWTYP